MIVMGFPLYRVQHSSQEKKLEPILLTFIFDGFTKKNLENLALGENFGKVCLSYG